MKRKKLSTAAKIVGFSVLLFIILLTVSEIIIAVLNNALADTELAAYSYTLIVIPVIALGVVVLFIVLMINFNRRANLLVESLNSVAGGDYSVRLPDRGAGNFGTVYGNFNKMTKELGAAKSSREEFVHSLSHEFKTPLCSIEGFAALLSEGGLSEEESKKYLKIIAEEAERLRKLADGVLTLSKLEQMEFMGESVSFRLDEQIRDCVILSERDWAKKNIEIELNLSPVTISGDRDLLRGVWTNLLSNAIKFSAEGGKIEIGLKENNGFAKITLKDFGVGLSEEECGKIFDKYYRTPSAKGVAGNGLGLTICKRICTLANGSITCKSKKGEGCEFTVTLPL